MIERFQDGSFPLKQFQVIPAKICAKQEQFDDDSGVSLNIVGNKSPSSSLLTKQGLNLVSAAQRLT